MTEKKEITTEQPFGWSIKFIPSKEFSGFNYKDSFLPTKIYYADIKKYEELKKLKDEGFLVSMERIFLESNDPIKEVIEKKKRKIILKGTEEINYKYPALTIEILQLILSRKRNEASELIVTGFMDNNYIYTTRNDQKSEVWIYNEGIYIPQGRTFIKEYCREVLDYVYNPEMVNNVIAKIETQTYIDEKKFFSNNIIEKIAVQNGLLNIYTKELEPFDPGQIFFNKIPVTFDPKADCPIIKKHFREITKHEQDPLLLIEIIGYTLLKKHHIEKAFMFNGSGRNGKSKTEELIKNFLGPENCSNLSLKRIEIDKFAKSEMFGKLVNLSGEVEGGVINDSSTFKELTGGDTISAPRKFLNDIYFQSYTKNIYSCNELPKVKDNTFAFWNRWILFDFSHVFLSKEELAEKTEVDKEELKELTGGNFKLADKEIINKLSSPEELSGLLNYALEGLQRLLENKTFSYSKSTAQVQDAWIRKSDSFKAFLMDCVEPEYSEQVTKQALKDMYSKYCKKHQVDMCSDVEISKTITTTFAVTAKRIMVEKVQETYWVGVRLKGEVFQ